MCFHILNPTVDPFPCLASTLQNPKEDSQGDVPLEAGAFTQTGLIN